MVCWGGREPAEPTATPSITAQPASEGTCSSGEVILNPQRLPGLLADCNVLLPLRDTIAGDNWLNWSTELPIGYWTAVTVAGFPRRVTRVSYSSLRGVQEILKGTIPGELSGLTKLETLFLSDNELTGEIPPELGNLANLEEMSLSSNQLTGEIPPELGNLTNLKKLSLSDNQLSGEIPPELGSLTSLRELILSGNQLTGDIPPELGNLKNLRWLDLRNNGLTGEIPPELRALKGLRALYLSGNQLTECIPATLLPPYYFCFALGDTIHNFPVEEVSEGILRDGARIENIRGRVSISMPKGGTLEYRDIYGCGSKEGCRIEDGRVVQGSITVSRTCSSGVAVPRMREDIIADSLVKSLCRSN